MNKEYINQGIDMNTFSTMINSLHRNMKKSFYHIFSFLSISPLLICGLIAAALPLVIGLLVSIYSIHILSGWVTNEFGVFISQTIQFITGMMIFVLIGFYFGFHLNLLNTQAKVTLAIMTLVRAIQNIYLDDIHQIDSKHDIEDRKIKITLEPMNTND